MRSCYCRLLEKVSFVGALKRNFSNRSFNILGIQQVAIGGLDKGALKSFWVDTLGIPKSGEYTSEVSTF